MRILMHPDNREYFERLFEKRGPWVWDFIPPPSIDGIPVVFDRAIPPRNLREVWHPPEAERFVSYGPEDECWMRPLGLGRIEVIDEGPCYFVMNEPIFTAQINYHPPVGLTVGWPF